MTAGEGSGRKDSTGESRRARRMDPRISARRTAVIREQGRRRLIIAGTALGVAGLVVGGWFLVHTPLFSARSVTVTGNLHESAAEVVAQAGLAGHPPLVDVNTGAAAARLEQLPWVRAATVHVSWPDGVHIAVTEETARFTVATPAGAWESLSSDGRVLGESATRPAGLLLLTLPEPPGQPGTLLSNKDAPGLRVASTLPPSFVGQVTGVTVEPAGWVQLALTTPIVVDIGTTSELTAKYEDVTSILAGATLHNGDVIDVSVPDAPTVTSG
ncbi:MAG: FtsQ-type POTRA domain-containing protein [Acidimicrobiales bacterium]